ncbi:MAG: GNAT family N-acetyltransferase [Bacteroidales bacterium]
MNRGKTPTYRRDPDETIRIVTLGELREDPEAWLNPQHGVLPFSPWRLRSYVNNPRAVDTDPVLLECLSGGQRIAFRTLLPDTFGDIRNGRQRFAWLSGNYVVPDFRRHGISTRLLEKAEEAWEGRLMYTNYAPASKALYDKSGRFQLLQKRDGSRFHLRAASSHLLGNRWGPLLSKTLLRPLDRAVNVFRDTRLDRLPGMNSALCTLRELHPKEMIQKTERSLGTSLFQRDHELFSWILEDSWIRTEQTGFFDYPFSHSANLFSNRFFELVSADENQSVVLWILQRDSHLVVPYAYGNGDRIWSWAAVFLLDHMARNRVDHLTIRNEKLLPHLRSLKSHFWMIRPMAQLLFVHKNLAPLLPENINQSPGWIQDGDGDLVFTGLA